MVVGVKREQIDRYAHLWICAFVLPGSLFLLGFLFLPCFPPLQCPAWDTFKTLLFFFFCCTCFLFPWALLWALPISLGSLLMSLKYKRQSDAFMPAPLFLFYGTGSFPGGPVASSCVKEGMWSACLTAGSFSSFSLSVFEPSDGLFVGVGVWIFFPLRYLLKQIFLSFNNSTHFVHQESLHLFWSN